VLRRRWFVLPALVVLAAAGCGGHTSSHRQRTTAAPVPTRKAKRHAARHPRVARRDGRVVVSVVDGDTGAPVARARVAAGAAAGVTSRRGVARLAVLRRTSLPVRVAAPGYLPLQTRVQFRKTPLIQLHLYRRELQWTMYGVDPQRTQAHPAIRLRPPFRIVWARDLGTLVEFPAAIYEGVAYISNLHGTLWALSMANGKVLWHFYMGHDEQDSSPAVVGDDVIAHSKGGRVFVFDRRTGRLRWSFGAASYIESSPVVVDGVDYFGDWAGNVYALDLRTHRLRWERSFGAKITSSVALSGNRIYLGDYAGRVWALSRTTGAVRWSGSVNGRVYGTPAIGGGRVFVPSSDGNTLTAFSLDGARLWSYDTGAYVYSSPAYWHGRVYVGSYNGLLYCFAGASGRVLWDVDAGGAVSGAPTIVDGVVYAGSFAHRIVGADALTGRVVFRFPHGEYVALSANGGRALLLGYNRVFAAVPR